MKDTFSCQVLHHENVFSKNLIRANKKELSSVLETENKIEIVDTERPVLDKQISEDSDAAHSEATTTLPQPIIAAKSSGHHSETSTNEINQVRYHVSYQISNIK